MAQVPSNCNNGGFTLIEVLVAIMIMTVGMLGLLQAVNVAMEHNLRNQMREQGVYVGAQVIKEMRGKPFGTVFTELTSIPMKNLRGMSTKFDVERKAAKLGDETEQYDVTVKWTYKGRSYQNHVVTVRGK